LLDRHPDVYMAKPIKPEPKFFLVDGTYAKGLPFYSDTWFAPAPAVQKAGEKSTDYLESGAAAERIGRDLPSTKLIFILREPAERAYSNYLWSKMNGIETESFETALALEAERERTLPERWKFARPFSYFSRGLYADLLAPYLARFATDQILVVKFEDIIDRPALLAARVQHFIGVSERGNDAAGLGVVNPSEKGSQTLEQPIRAELQSRYAEPNLRLAAMLGPAFNVW